MKLLSLCILTSIIFAGCEKTVAPDAENTAERPSIVFEGFEAFGTRGEKREWKALAEKAEVYNDRKIAIAHQLKIDYYQKEKVVSVLQAQRGEINTANQNFTAEGNVILTAENGVILTTSRLYWDHAKERIHTPAAVKVIRKDSVMTGIGLVSDRNLGYVEVLKEVKIEARSVNSLRQLGAEFDTSTP